MPILEYLHQNKEDLYFVDDITPLENENITTIITGRNSVGKSRLLRSIIIDCLKNDKFNKVIAISNTQYHKFPSYTELLKKNFKKEKYTKLAFEAHTLPRSLRHSENIELPCNSFIQKFLYENKISFQPNNFNTNLNFLMCMDFFIVKLSKNIKTRIILFNILEFLNLDIYIKIDFISMSRLRIKEDINAIIENYVLHNDINREDFESLIKLKNSILDFYNLRSVSLFNLDENQLESLSLLIEHGLIKARRISFSKEKNILNYNDLSSGELAILSLILSLSSTLDNNSIVCIDEPELNLHPEWQEKIIQLIELVSNYFHGCHFFIATHSPQLISGVCNHNTFILDLSKNKISNIIKYKNRSSDFQLSEIFNFPGNNNEYLIRKLLVILNKLNSEENFFLDKDSKEILMSVNELIKKEKINDNDKVKILFNLINDFRG